MAHMLFFLVFYQTLLSQVLIIKHVDKNVTMRYELTIDR